MSNRLVVGCKSTAMVFDTRQRGLYMDAVHGLSCLWASWSMLLNPHVHLIAPVRDAGFASINFGLTA